MTAADGVARLLARNGPLLLDFDGPVCSIFAGYPAPVIAGELVSLLRKTDLAVPEMLADEPDPLEVLRWVGANGSTAEIVVVEEALCAAELRAVATAEPTAFGREVIVAARQVGLPVAIVSNNSAGAISGYLATHRLSPHVSAIVGRAFADPGQMKPNPAPILQAARSLGADPSGCVLVGDSLADIEGARAAGVPVIGYANRPHKVARFADAGADCVVTSMGAIADALLIQS